MTHTARIKLAALIVLLFLATVSVAGVLSHHQPPAGPVTGQVPSAVPTPVPAQNFEQDNHD